MTEHHANTLHIPAGTEFGPYEIVALIGAGGMGEVYQARDRRLQRDVALKVIRAAWSNDPERRRRFETEARLAARLAHPNVVAVYDVCELGEVPYLVTELVDGGTLADRIRRGPLPFSETMPIALGIAEGLAAAHGRQVVHRDLKPDNVLLSSAGVPKISDFGLSKCLEPEGHDGNKDSTTAVAGITRDGAIVGTPAYMSPEQAEGRAADFRCDQFALGVAVLEMLTGRRPFQRATSPQTLAAVIECDIDFDALERSVPAELVLVLRRCLARDPAGRYGSTADLVHDLRRIAAQPTPARGRGSAGLSRRAIVTWLVPLAAILVAGATALMWRQTPSTVPAGKIESIAVLPLSNFSGDQSQDYFADAMTEELTAQLAAVRSLRVISRTSASAYRRTSKRLSAVARELGADGLIEGSVIRTGDRARITVQLIDGKSDRHVWSQSFESTGSDILTLQRDVAREIVEQVRAKLSPAEQVELKRLPTRSVAAYEAYLHAQYKYNTALQIKADADDALRHAETAVKLDPGFAEAWVLVAKACQAQIFGWDGGKEYDEKGFVAVEKALALNPSLADAFVARGMLQFNQWHRFDIPAAIRDFRKAVSLNPNLASAHHGLGSDMTHLGLHDEAVQEFQTALRLDPGMSGPKFRMARALWQSNRFDEAIAVYERYDLIMPERVSTLIFSGRVEAARRFLESDSPRIDVHGSQADRNADLLAIRALLHAVDQKPAESRAHSLRSYAVAGKTPHFHHAAFVLAAAAAELNQPAEAVRWLQFAAGTGMPNYPLFRDNPSMKKLQGHPVYETFMAALRLRWDEMVASSRR